MEISQGWSAVRDMPGQRLSTSSHPDGEGFPFPNSLHRSAVRDQKPSGIPPSGDGIFSGPQSAESGPQALRDLRWSAA